MGTALGLIGLLTAQSASSSQTGHPRFEFELEAGPVWQSRNDVQIPNNQAGTRFSLVDVVGKGPFPAARLYVTWNVSNRHGLRALLAPLSITGTGTLAGPVEFAGASYGPGVPVDATYKFNSWRLTYRYKFHDGRRFRWWIGFTAKIRDAEIKLQQAGTSSNKTDLGFVPLLHIGGQYRFDERWLVILDVDALAGGPGRAVDAAVKVGYDIYNRWAVRAGYRTVEGGADVEEVYNFAWLHYVFASIVLTI
jgi:hypothetical protein